MTATRRLLRHPLLWILLGLGLILLGASLLLNGQARIAAGSSVDARYGLDGFYGPEPSPHGPFRWTQPYAELRWPHAGLGPLTLRLTLLDGAPTPRAVWITLDGQEIYRGQTQPGGAPWVVQVAANARSDTPVLGIAADPWTPPGDSRTLGVGVQAVAVDAPAAGGVAALRLLALLAALLVLVHTATRVTGHIVGPLVVALGVLAFAGPLLAYGDPWLAVAAPVALVGSLGVALLVGRTGYRRIPGGAVAWGLGALAGGLLLFTLGRFNTGDAEAMFQITAGLVEDGVPWAHQDHAWVKFGLGQPLIQAPLYLLGRAWAEATGGDVAGLTRFCVVLLNPLIVTATAGVLFFAARRRWGTGVGLALGGTWLLATPALTYARLAFAEPLSGLLVLTAVVGVGAAPGVGGWGLGVGADGNPPAPSRRAIFVAGLCLGLAVLVKPANAIYLPLPGLYLLWRLLIMRPSSDGALSHAAPSHATRFTFHVSRFTFHVSRFTVQALAAFALGLAPGLGATAGYNALRYGSPLVFGYEREGFTTPVLVGLYGLTVSSGKGLIWFAPPVILGAVGLVRMLRGRDRADRAAAVLIAGQVAIVLVFHALWSSWEGNIAWGPRLILPVVPLLLWPLGTLAGSRTARRGWWALGAAGLLVAVPGALIDQYYYFDQFGVTAAGTAIELLMLFEPGWSQIVAHWRYLLGGTFEAVTRPVLTDFGLGPGWDVAVPAVLTLLALGGVAGVLLAGRAAMQGED